MNIHKLQLPLSNIPSLKLQAGDKVLLSGNLYTARDQAHKRLCELIKAGDPLPWDLAGSAIFYCGPFQDQVSITWEQKQPESCELSIYNLKGQLQRRVGCRDRRSRYRS